MPSTDYVPTATDRKIIIQRAAIEIDASGQEISTWVDWKERRAAVLQSSGHSSGIEALAGGKETASLAVQFTTRYVPGLTEKDRIAYDGYYYDIISIVELGRRHYMQITTNWQR